MIWTKLSKHTDLGLLILRIGFGLGMLIFHGWGKLVGGPEEWNSLGQSLEVFGIGFGHTFFGFLAAFAESIGAICIILGLFYRPAVAMLGFTMLVATMSHVITGDGSPAHAFKNFFVCAGMFLIGPGKYSIDCRFAGKTAGSAAALVLLLVVIPNKTLAQHSTVHDQLTMESQILDSERKFAVYLPPDYHTSERSYPALYLLHGAGDDQTGWIQFGEVRHIADKAIREGKATPMIIIMPDANTGVRGYFNDVTNSWRYEDFFFEELIPHVEERFRIKPEKRYRAVAGLSMGGGGSFIYALRRPELFSSAAPLSAWVGPSSAEDYKSIMERWGNDLSGISDDAIEEYVKRHNAVELIRTLPEGGMRSVRWFIDCGDDDFLYEGNSLAHIELRKREIPHEFRIRDGAHTWTYWRDSLPVVLHFISQAFHQH